MPFFYGPVQEYAEVVSALSDEEMLTDLVESKPSEEFRYIGGVGEFDPDELRPVARLMLDKLRAIGATRFYVRYDGGHDSGFAHSDRLLFGNEERNLVDVLREVGTGDLRERIRSEARDENRWGDPLGVYANASPIKAAHYAFDELAVQLAVHLLGHSYGTGMYDLYGAFTADLETCQLIDDPNAQKPDHME